MRICDVFELGIIKDDTEVYIRNADHTFRLLAKGNWYEDHVLDYIIDIHPIRSFTWQDDNKIYIDIIM